METIDILNCDEQRQFWVTWMDDTIRVGEGAEIGQLEILLWPDPNLHPVFSVGLSTGYTATGQWIIGDIEGE